MVKRIFLDSKDWITLAKIANGKEKDPILINVYQKIKKLSDTSKAIFPFSMFHLEDMMKNSNKRQREELIDIMIAISKGWVMKPYVLFFKKEIENATLHRLGLNSIHDIKSQIIGKGLAYTAGEEYRITSTNQDIQKLLDKKEHEIRNLIDSTESMKKLMKGDDFFSFFKQGERMYLDVALQMENNRKQKTTQNKTQRYYGDLVSYFFHSIVPHLAKFLQNNNIQKDASKLFKTKKEIESFLEDMPSINTLFRLSFARDEESPERVIPPNDIIDVSHLAGAVPYCDIVVMEKMFASICRKVKLDKKYGCIVLSSLKDLNELL